MGRRRRLGGSAMVEFALCGIPLIFVWISTVQMALGMWHYHTLQYATKAAGAYMSTHGASYVAAGNAAPQIQDIAGVLSTAAIGIPASEIQTTFTAYLADGTTTTTHSCRLDNCKTDAAAWPPTGGYNALLNKFEIKTEYQWHNALAMVTPGNGTVNFGAFWFPGYTQQFILF